MNPSVKVKICGICRIEDAEAAARSGADALGFVLVRGARREVEPVFVREAIERVRALAGRAPSFTAVVANLGLEPESTTGPSFSVDKYLNVVEVTGVDTLQLHGSETPEFARKLRGKAPKLRLIRAISPADRASLKAWIDWASSDAKSGLLVDSSGGGGVGQLADWAFARDISRQIDIGLAGGLTSENVASAVRAVGPAWIDVSSGVERELRVKDHNLLTLFIERARQGGHQVLKQTQNDPPNGYETEDGKFGKYGGRFVPETLMAPVMELRDEYFRLKQDPEFQRELAELLKNYVGRPTALTLANRLSAHNGGAKIYLKREDLAHTGAHKINNTLGQVLMAKRLGKTRIVAETGAGQHGVATAAAAALLGFECRVYMGAVDVERQFPNVERMKLFGAEVVPVTSGTRTLKDAINEAMRDWITNVRSTFYVLGSVLGPDPYPRMVRDFQTVIGREARAQFLEREGRLPDEIVACVGGGSNAIGMFFPFLNDSRVKMIGVEAGGEGVASGNHAARFATGSPGVFQGSFTYLLQDRDGQILPTHSISAGLDHAGVGPEHAHLREIGRIQYTSATDQQALEALRLLARYEGILPALESSHALAIGLERAREIGPGGTVLVNLSGRGDKDLANLRGSLS